MCTTVGLCPSFSTPRYVAPTRLRSVGVVFSSPPKRPSAHDAAGATAHPARCTSPGGGSLSSPPPAPSAGSRLLRWGDSTQRCCSPPHIAMQPVRPMVDNSTAHEGLPTRPRAARPSQRRRCPFTLPRLTCARYLPASDNARKGPAHVPSFPSGPHPGGSPKPASDAQGRPDSQHLSTKKPFIW